MTERVRPRQSASSPITTCSNSSSASGPGDLFRARDTRLGRTVAVRLLPADFTADRRAALIEQAPPLIALSHPNVTALFDVGEHDGRIYLAFEFLKGQSLRAEMAGRPMNVRRAVEIAIQIADAVADAMRPATCHGGLSPDSSSSAPRGTRRFPAFELAAQERVSSRTATTAGCSITTRREEAEASRPTTGRTSIGRRDPLRNADDPAADAPRCVCAERVQPRRSRRSSTTIVLKALSPNADSRYQSAVAFAGGAA